MKSITMATILFALALLMFSCEHGPIGIYYSLEVETDLEDNDSLDNTITVRSMAKVGSDYYIGAGVVFTRADVDGSTWAQIAPPEGYSTSTEVAESGNVLFAVYSTLDGAGSTLFSYSSGTWVPVSSLNGKRCDTVMSAEDGAGNDVLFAGIRNTDGSFSIYSSTDNGSVFSLAGSSFTRPIRDVAWVADASGSTTGDFWIITGTTLLTSPDTSPETLTVSTNTPDTTSVYGGLFYSSGLHVPFISTLDGYVHGLSGGTWITSTQVEDELYDFEELVIGENNVILVGALNGYYEMVFNTVVEDPITLLNPGIARESLSTNLNYLNTTLSDNVINALFTDTIGDTQKLFACTSGDGLWVNIPQGSYRVWGRE